MTHSDPADDVRDSQLVAERSHLLPEEEAAGSADPQTQADAILQESLERTDDPEGARDESSQTLGSSGD